jgi:TonB family protein
MCGVAAAVAIAAAQDPPPVKPKLRGGGVPELPVRAVTGGEVLLELSLSARGQVTGAAVLRSTPPFTDAMLPVVRTWEFVPPEDDEHRPIESRVLVAGLFRPPALYASPGDSNPIDVGHPARDIPFPLGTIMPVFPPLAHSGGVVLLEALIGATGGVEGVQVIRSAPPFDSAAVDAARRWLFRPAYVAQRAEPRYAYLVFGFPTPITGAVATPRAPG